MNHRRGGMRPLQGSARHTDAVTRPPAWVTRAARLLAEQQGIPDGAFLAALILRELAREGYADDAARPAPRRRDGEPRGSGYIAASLTEQEAALAAALAAREGLTPHAWRVRLLTEAAAGAGYEPGEPAPPPGPAPAQPAGDFAAAAAALEEEGISRDEAIRRLAGQGYSLREIGAHYGLSRGRVSQVCDPGYAGKRRKWRRPAGQGEA